MTEIIDLTLSPQAPETIEILSDGADSTVTSRQNASRQLKRRKSKKWKKSKGPLSDGVDSAAQSSRACTPTQCSTQIGQPSSRRSGSPPPRVATPITDESTLFFLDAAAAPVDLGMDPPNAQLGAPAKASIKLLLPSHVSVLNSGGDAVVPVEIIPSATNSDEEDYIEYLDYEYGKAPGQVRYFEVDAEDGQTKPSIFKCKNCGVEGEHKTYECLVQICLTCGARDEHSTRSCPISKICYTCGMKGHINKSCPNRFSRPTLAAGSYNDCDRCGSRDHKMNECPTLWRIYQYVNDEEHILIRQSREDRSHLSIGQGGEGYIGMEEWCYNCANPGHLGDDCDKLPHPSGFPAEPSAFGVHNIMAGPFYDPATETERFCRVSRDLQTDNIPREERAIDVPVNVGKHGRNRDRERLQKRFREQEDDEGDWFSNAHSVKTRDIVQKDPPRGKVMKFGNSLKDAKRQFSPQPVIPSTRSGGSSSLLARIGNGRSAEGFDRSVDRSHSGGSQSSLRIRGAANDRNPDGRSSRKDDQERDKRRRGGERDGGSWRNHGPRYRGGYIK